MMTRMLAQLRVQLAKPMAPWLIIALGAILMAPSIWTGLMTDDYLMLSQLRTPQTIELARGPWDLFVIAPRTPSALKDLVDQGVLPWWTDPQLRWTRFHPLPSLTHAFDQAVWPNWPPAWHVHSLLWFVVALVGVGLLYRQLFKSPAPAALALLFFALDSAHGPAVAWITARHCIMGMAFAAPAMWAHVKWRNEGWRPGAVLGPIFLALGLLSSEIALAACAYMFAFEVFLDTGSLTRRLSRLSGLAAVTVLWAVTYVALGNGTAWQSLYVDPVHEPLVFLRELVFRLPVQVVAQLFVPWSDPWVLYGLIHPALPYVFLTYELVALAGMTVVALPRLRRDPLARFAACGMLLSALPGCAGPPQDRLLLFVGIGGMALAAVVVEAYVLGEDRAETPFRRRWLGAVPVALILLVHVVSNLYWLPARTQIFSPPYERANNSIPKTEAIRQRSVILVNPPYDLFAYYMSLIRDSFGEARPAHVRVLATSYSAVTVTRLDDRTLRVRPDAGFLANFMENEWRSPRHHLGAGRVAELSDVDVDVDEVTTDGRPAQATFHFSVPLEDPSLTWFQWGDREFAPFSPPAIGETVRLKPADFRRVLFMRD